MTRKRILDTKSSDISSKCLVCGDTSRGVNFGLLTCMPCKSFFRKNVFRKTNLHCEFNNNCSITKLTRSFCAFCRLKKCFKLGMDPDLIRKVPQPYDNLKKNLTKRKQSTLPAPKPLSLLKSDCSGLSTDDWSILSNFVRGYDERNTCKNIEYYINELSSLPPKLRMRTSTACNIIAQYNVCIRPIVQYILNLYNLSLDARRAVAKHNLYYTGAFNGLFLSREFELFQNPDFADFCVTYFGYEVTIEASQTVARCESNGNLIKIMLIILAFSSNCSLIIYDGTETISTMESSIYLVRIQNIYVTVLWKYLIYLFGYKEAIIRYSHMIKNIIDVIKMLSPMGDNKNDFISGTVHAEIERTLTIQN